MGMDADEDGEEMPDAEILYNLAEGDDFWSSVSLTTFRDALHELARNGIIRYDNSKVDRTLLKASPPIY